MSEVPLYWSDNWWRGAGRILPYQPVFKGYEAPPPANMPFPGAADYFIEHEASRAVLVRFAIF